jgi:hypothetical protein
VGIERLAANEWRSSAALKRAQQAAPLQRKSLAGVWVGGVPLVTASRGVHGNGGFTAQCCRGDSSPPCLAPIPNLIFIATMIGSSEAEGKDLNVVNISDCSHSVYDRRRQFRRTEKSRRDALRLRSGQAGATQDKDAIRRFGASFFSISLWRDVIAWAGADQNVGSGNSHGDRVKSWRTF